MKTYIIGMGTGHCGTKTLTQLLNDCPNCNIRHEWIKRTKNTFKNKGIGTGQPKLDWEFNKTQAIHRIKCLLKMPGNFVGDIAFYNINYIDYFFNNLPSLKIIHLWRDKKEHLESQLISLSKNKRNNERGFWLPKNHPYYIRNKCIMPDKYKNALPKFPQAKDKADAINKYWDLYWSLVKKLKNKYSEKILSIQTKELSKKYIQKIIFNFIGIPEKDRIYQKIKRR